MFKRAAKSIIRTPVKSLIFEVLLIVISIFFVLSVSIWRSSDRIIREADKNYTTVVNFNYQSTEEIAQLDLSYQSMIEEFDFSLLSDHPSVKSLKKNVSYQGYTDNLIRTDNNNGMREYSVIEVSLMGMTQDEQSYFCLLTKSLYGFGKKENTFVFVKKYDEDGNELFHMENDHHYLVNGMFTNEYGSQAFFQPIPLGNLAAKQYGEDLSSLPCAINLDYCTDKEKQIFEDIAESYRITNNALDLIATNDIKAESIFLSNSSEIISGRFFEKEEYITDKSVCVISDLLAKKLQLSVGDTLNTQILKEYPFDHEIKNIKNLATILAKYWSEDGFLKKEEYEIVGIYKTPQEGIYNVYLPDSSLNVTSARVSSYNFAFAIVKNGQAEPYVLEIEKYLAPKMSYTINDQGFLKIYEPLKTVRNFGILLTVISFCCFVTVLIVFLFLLIGKQRETADIMLSLGTKKCAVRRFLVYQTGMLFVLADVIGCIAGYLISGSLLVQTYEKAQSFSQIDRRYSLFYSSAGNVDFHVKFPISKVFLVVLFFALVFFAVLLSEVIAYYLIHKIYYRQPKRKKAVHISLHRESGNRMRFGSHLPAQWMRYAWASMLRNGIRTKIILVVSFFLGLLICFMQGSRSSYVEKLQKIYDSSDIYLYMTSYNGKYFDNLGIAEEEVEYIGANDWIGNINTSTKIKYALTTISQKADGSYPGDLWLRPNLPEADNEFAIETYSNYVSGLENLIITNSPENTPVFMNQAEGVVTYLNGYDDNSFTTQEAICILPAELMARYNIELGDTVLLDIYRIVTVTQVYSSCSEFKVVGSYTYGLTSQNAYIGLGYTKDINSEDGITIFNYGRTYDSANFLLSDNTKLSQIKDWLNLQGYSSIDKQRAKRITLALDDYRFNYVVNNSKRNLSYINFLTPILFIITGSIGFMVSYLFIKVRRLEIAIMRSIGTTKYKIFLSLFLEQALLCILGSLLGFIVYNISMQSVSTTRFIYLVGYQLCYFFGTAVAIHVILSTNVLSMLSSKES